MSEEVSELERLWKERLQRLQAAYQEALGNISPLGFAVEVEAEKGGKSYACLYYGGEGWMSIPAEDCPDPKEGMACVARHLLRLTVEIYPEMVEVLCERIREVILTLDLL